MPLDDFYGNSPYKEHRFEKCVVHFTNNTQVEILPEGDEYYYETTETKKGLIFSLKKNESIDYTAQAIQTELQPHCQGSHCYYTGEYITVSEDTFHLLLDWTSEGESIRLIREYPFNADNVKAQLSDENQSLEV